MIKMVIEYLYTFFYLFEYLSDHEVSPTTIGLHLMRRYAELEKPPANLWGSDTIAVGVQLIYEL